MDVLPLILIQIVTFVILIVLLRMFFMRHAGFALSRLKGLNEQNLGKEQLIKEELIKAHNERNAIIEEAQKQAKEIKQQAAVLMDKAKEDAFLATREESKRILAEAARHKECLEREFLSRVRKNSRLTAVELIKMIFSQEATRALHQILLEELILELDKIETDKLPAVPEEIEAKSAINLSEAQKNKIRAIFEKKLNKKVSVHASTDENLVAGLELHLGTLLIDGSLANKFKKALANLPQNTN